MSQAGILDPKARRSSTNISINMLTMHVRLALKVNESGQPMPPTYQHKFAIFLQCIDEAIALTEYHQNLSMGKPASREGLSRPGSTEEARIHCVIGAARKFYGMHEANDELKKLSSYLRRYGLASTHRSPQYEKAKAFIVYLSEYDARYTR